MCKKKGCHKACVTCLVAYHNHCGHTYTYPSAAPLHKSHRQLPRTRLRSLLNHPAMKKRLSHLHAACGGKCGHKNAPSGQCRCTIPFQGSGFGGKRLQHYTSTKHEAWVHAPPPPPSIFCSIGRFVVKGAAPHGSPSSCTPRNSLTLSTSQVRVSPWCVTGLYKGSKRRTKHMAQTSKRTEQRRNATYHQYPIQRCADQHGAYYRRCAANAFLGAYSHRSASTACIVV